MSLILGLSSPIRSPTIAVQEIQTHTAHIFLVGASRAYKLQRQVKFPFMDLSGLHQRKVACDKEVSQILAFSLRFRALTILVFLYLGTVLAQFSV